MKEQFIDYTIALELKELGFDEPCLALLDSNNELYTDGKSEHFKSQEKVQYIFGNDIVEVILAPLWQQIIDWFREKYGLHIDIGLEDKEKGYYNYAINLNWRYEGGTYYEARKLAILDAIRVVQDKEDKSWRFPYETN
jgi:hypothetical protein